LIDGAALIEQFSSARVADAVVNELVSRVDVEIDPEMDAIYPDKYAGIVHITLHDGRMLTALVHFDNLKGW